MKRSTNALFSTPVGVAEAETALKDAGAALEAAGINVQRARAALDAAYDTNDSERIIKAKAELSRLEADQDDYAEREKAAQRRLNAAKTAHDAEKRGAGVEKLKQACKERSEAAAQIDQAFTDLATAITKLDAADTIVTELRHVHSPNAVFGHNFGAGRQLALLKFAAARNRIPSADYVGSPSDIKTTAEMVQRDNATILFDVK